MKTIRVVIVDDSPICRAQLRSILHADKALRVVGEAADGARALETVSRKRPDLVTMDLRMPGADGFEVIERMMAETPVPILIVTGQATRRGREAVFEAIRRGALDLVEKPAMGALDAERELRTRVKLLAQVPVVRHVAGRRARAEHRPRSLTPAAPVAHTAKTRVVGLAASAGGPAAVVEVLSRLDRDFPACVALVQHLPPGYAHSFAQFVQTRTELTVKVVEHATNLEPGVVFVAPDRRHLVLASPHTLAPLDGAEVDGHCPSATVLFRSLAKIAGSSALGVILSGMGNDGARGLLELKERGALTIAQRQEGCAVYGMPRAAAENGAAQLLLDPAGIAAEVRQVVNPRGNA
jgi:two-component system chemotaxis response regulator CheB